VWAFQQTALLWHLAVAALYGVIALCVLCQRPVVARQKQWLHQATVVASLLGSAVLLQTLRLPSSPVYHVALPSVQGVLGWACVWLGWAGTLAALVQLGPCFGLLAAYRGRVCQTGLYALMPHPMYVFQLLSLFGCWLLSPSPAGGLLLLGVAGLTWLRAREEDRLLAPYRPPNEVRRAAVPAAGCEVGYSS
jgi:protein-S-isoprenylcysteine O-methyltransferase Ste14